MPIMHKTTDDVELYESVRKIDTQYNIDSKTKAINVLLVDFSSFEITRNLSSLDEKI
jgi:hypothetical protein|tara:strand:- start:150 stop:320 length:171 start_codon:yes stop_codon:yes gene_type:complete